jgi:hypothetical protein
MKLLSLALLGAFAFALVGCEASGHVSDNDRDSSDRNSSYRKTTFERPSGETTIRTETRHDND